MKPFGFSQFSLLPIEIQLMVFDYCGKECLLINKYYHKILSNEYNWIMKLKLLEVGLRNPFHLVSLVLKDENRSRAAKLLLKLWSNFSLELWCHHGYSMFSHQNITEELLTSLIKIVVADYKIYLLNLINLGSVSTPFNSLNLFFYIVCGFGQIEIVKFLVEDGADIHFHPETGKTDSPIISATEGRHLHVIKYLVSKGANLHANNEEALMTAVNLGDLSIIKYCIEQGSNIHINNDEAFTLAAAGGHLHVLEYLMEHGANLHADDESALVGASEEGHLAVVKYLIDNGADVNISNGNPIRIAYENGHKQVVDYLLSRGASESDIL